ncbi:TetR/AcrR family transcriptional regulator [Streptomyces pharetrae]|uniref:TetR/AcrR family transcriptional regulator n=1 Tax=Streptomyces pharetrae TaxID=291370 RepID=UPI003D9DFAE2
MVSVATTDSLGARRRGRPRRIEAGQIVDVTRRIILEEGVEAVSMRRIAKEVGTTPMALYHHVRDKVELLMLTLTGMVAAVPRPSLPDDPRERILVTAVHMHDVLAEMIWVVDILALGDLTDKDAWWTAEEIIDSAIACGLSPEEAVHAYHTLWYVIHGSLVFRRADARRAADPDRAALFPDLITEEDADELPRLAALSNRWHEVKAGYDIREQLERVLDGLLRRPRP